MMTNSISFPNFRTLGLFRQMDSLTLRERLAYLRKYRVRWEKGVIRDIKPLPIGKSRPRDIMATYAYRSPTKTRLREHIDSGRPSNWHLPSLQATRDIATFLHRRFNLRGEALRTLASYFSRSGPGQYPSYYRVHWPPWMILMDGYGRGSIVNYLREQIRHNVHSLGCDLLSLRYYGTRKDGTWRACNMAQALAPPPTDQWSQFITVSLDRQWYYIAVELADQIRIMDRHSWWCGQFANDWQGGPGKPMRILVHPMSYVDPKHKMVRLAKYAGTYIHYLRNRAGCEDGINAAKQIRMMLGYTPEPTFNHTKLG